MAVTAAQKVDGPGPPVRVGGVHRSTVIVPGGRVVEAAELPLLWPAEQADAAAISDAVASAWTTLRRREDTERSRGVEEVGAGGVGQADQRVEEVGVLLSASLEVGEARARRH